MQKHQFFVKSQEEVDAEWTALRSRTHTYEYDMGDYHYVEVHSVYYRTVLSRIATLRNPEKWQAASDRSK